MTENDGSTTVISKETKVPLWLSVIASMAVGGWILQDVMWKSNITRDIAELKIAAGDRWSGFSMELYTKEAARLNPEINWPNPKDYIGVQKAIRHE